MISLEEIGDAGEDLFHFDESPNVDTSVSPGAGVAQMVGYEAAAWFRRHLHSLTAA